MDIILTGSAVRKIAKENNIDFVPNQRILKGYLLTILNPNATTQKQHSAKGTLTVMLPSPSVASRKTPPAPIPIRSYDGLMIKTMTESLTIPYMTYTDEIDFTHLHEKINNGRRTTTTNHFKLFYLPFSIEATSLSFKHNPTLNAILPSPPPNIGIARDAPRGLAVPVLKDVRHLPLIDIATELKRLPALAIENNLSSNDVSHATFLLSNIEYRCHGRYLRKSNCETCEVFAPVCRGEVGGWGEERLDWDGQLGGRS